MSKYILTLDSSILSCNIHPSGSLGIITVDQSPAVINAKPQDTVKIFCRASQYIHRDMSLHQFKAGQTPKALIYFSDTRHSGTPERFSGSETGALTTFIISGVQLEDEAEYHCAHSEERPFTQ